MDDTLRIEHRAGWRRLVLNRPDRLNALTSEMRRFLLSAVADAEADPSCRALLLTGEGRGFCAGQDLVGPLDTAGAEIGRVLDEEYNPLVRRLRASPLPVVCAVNGVAAGAGANLALACDIVLAARSATFVQAFVKIGLIPDAGGTYVLPRLVGEARARAMALLGEPVTAEQAAAWGLIWRAVEDDNLTAEAEAMMAQLAASPATALALIKRALAASLGNDLEAQLALERALQSEAGRGADFAEGVSAFREKRKPVFRATR